MASLKLALYESTTCVIWCRTRVTKVVHDKALPFEPLIPNATTIEAMKDARAGKVTKAANLVALFADLNADA